MLLPHQDRTAPPLLTSDLYVPVQGKWCSSQYRPHQHTKIVIRIEYTNISTCSQVDERSGARSVRQTDRYSHTHTRTRSNSEQYQERWQVLEKKDFKPAFHHHLRRGYFF